MAAGIPDVDLGDIQQRVDRGAATSTNRAWAGRRRCHGRPDMAGPRGDRLLLGLIDGFSLHSLLDPERLSPERQIALVEGELDRLSSSHPTGLAPCGASPQSPRRAS